MPMQSVESSSGSGSPLARELDEPFKEMCEDSDAASMPEDRPGALLILPGQQKLTFTEAFAKESLVSDAKLPDLLATGDALPMTTPLPNASAYLDVEALEFHVDGKWELSSSSSSSTLSAKSHENKDDVEHDPEVAAAAVRKVDRPEMSSEGKRSRSASRTPRQRSKAEDLCFQVGQKEISDGAPFVQWSRKMPDPPPGTKHWMQPLWAAQEKKILEMPPLCRKVTLQSLCSGTAAELNAAEVWGMSLEKCKDTSGCCLLDLARCSRGG